MKRDFTSFFVSSKKKLRSNLENAFILYYIISRVNAYLA